MDCWLGDGEVQSLSLKKRIDSTLVKPQTWKIVFDIEK